MFELTLDFETRSRSDLKKVGMYRYAEDPSTDVLCLAVKANADEPKLWVPSWAHHMVSPEFLDWLMAHDLWLTDAELIELIEKADTIEAHNAGFERCIWHYVMTRYGFPDLPLEKMRCSAAKAAAMSLPRDLKRACEVMGVPQQKDQIGYKVMLKMCKPDRKGEWCEDPADFEINARYCMQDTRAEYDLSHVLPPLTEKEQRFWVLDQKINDRGIRVDTASIKKLVEKVKAKESRLLLEIQEITGGAVKTVAQRARTLDWLADQDVFLENMQKQSVEDALKLGLGSDKVKRLLEIRQSLGKTSVSKLDAMLRMACSDERVRGVFLFNGANTGRWTARGLQVHNYPRESFGEKDVEDFIALEESIAEILYGCVIQNASKCLRGMMLAEDGKELEAADFSAIEARVLAWLAGETKTLEAFRAGKDLYKVTAADIFRTSYEKVTKYQRQIGKVAVLALGYQGWIGAFDSMAAGYGVKIEGDPEVVAKAKLDAEAYLRGEIQPGNGKKFTAEETRRYTEPEAWAADERKKDIILAWRQANQNVVQFWKGVEEAALESVKTGKSYSYGRVKFGMRNGFLHCRLPSGRLLSYPKAFTKTVKTKYGQIKEVIGYFGIDDKGNWGELATYGGSITENIVQAIARDLLAESLVRAEEHGHPIVLHVHDEAVAERGNPKREEFEMLLSVVPSWADGLPLKAEGWTGKRYRK